MAMVEGHLCLCQMTQAYKVMSQSRYALSVWLCGRTPFTESAFTGYHAIIDYFDWTGVCFGMFNDPGQSPSKSQLLGRLRRVIDLSQVKRSVRRYSSASGTTKQELIGAMGNPDTKSPCTRRGLCCCGSGGAVSEDAKTCGLWASCVVPGLDIDKQSPLL